MSIKNFLTVGGQPKPPVATSQPTSGLSTSGGNANTTVRTSTANGGLQHGMQVPSSTAEKARQIAELKQASSKSTTIVKKTVPTPALLTANSKSMPKTSSSSSSNQQVKKPALPVSNPSTTSKSTKATSSTSVVSKSSSATTTMSKSKPHVQSSKTMEKPRPKSSSKVVDGGEEEEDDEEEVMEFSVEQEGDEEEDDDDDDDEDDEDDEEDGDHDDDDLSAMEEDGVVDELVVQDEAEHSKIVSRAKAASRRGDEKAAMRAGIRLDNEKNDDESESSGDVFNDDSADGDEEEEEEEEDEADDSASNSNSSDNEDEDEDGGSRKNKKKKSLKSSSSKLPFAAEEENFVGQLPDLCYNRSIDASDRADAKLMEKEFLDAMIKRLNASRSSKIRGETLFTVKSREKRPIDTLFMVPPSLDGDYDEEEEKEPKQKKNKKISMTTNVKEALVKVSKKKTVAVSEPSPVKKPVAPPPAKKQKVAQSEATKPTTLLKLDPSSDQEGDKDLMDVDDENVPRQSTPQGEEHDADNDAMQVDGADDNGDIQNDNQENTGGEDEEEEKEEVSEPDTVSAAMLRMGMTPSPAMLANEKTWVENIYVVIEHVLSILVGGPTALPLALKDTGGQRTPGIALMLRSKNRSELMVALRSLCELFE